MNSLPTPPTKAPTIPEGFCQCGCGQRTEIAVLSRKERGWIRGKPKRFFGRHRAIAPIECLLDPKTGCWNWQKGKTALGYGMFKMNGKNKYAHRHYYEMAHGTILDGLDILHKCDNSSCVNPDHLRAGTAKENTQDMVSKGRARYITHRGEDNGSSKLNNSKVIEIRNLAKGGWSQNRIARQFGISQTHVKDILKHRVWKHV